VIGPFVLLSLVALLLGLVMVGAGLAVLWQVRAGRAERARRAAGDGDTPRPESLAPSELDELALEQAEKLRVGVELSTPMPASALFLPLEQFVAGGRVLDPAAGGRRGVMVVHGEEGASSGEHLRVAARLAREGFAAMAYSWFGAVGRPTHLCMIDLDELRRAGRWLTQQPGVADSAVMIASWGRGAELSILAAGLEDGSDLATLSGGPAGPQLGPIVAIAMPFAVGPAMPSPNEPRAEAPAFAWVFRGRSPRAGASLVDQRVRGGVSVVTGVEAASIAAREALVRAIVERSSAADPAPAPRVE
jgi:hypothetical protein